MESLATVAREVRPKRPINADVPAPEGEPEAREEAAPAAAPPAKGEGKAAATEKAPSAKEPEQPGQPPKLREPRSRTPLLLAGLALLAIAFIVFAIVVGGGSDKSSETAPATAPAPSASEESSPEEASSQTAEALGYPGFATDNTTRVGGADPAANAAAVALGVFPSTIPSQRPAAVTVVDEAEPTTALAAAVMMAPPVRAPVLFAQGGELPEASLIALEQLGPRGDKDTGGTSAFALGRVSPEAIPALGKVRRVAGGASGDDAFSTAAAVAALRERLAGPPAHVVIAPASEPELATPAAAWAARSGDPVLYAEADKLPAATAAALKRHPKVPVYVLGPKSAISAGAVREIGKVANQVKRVGGDDPVANALAFSRYRDGDFGWDVNDPGHGFVLARSDSPLDGAAASALSGAGTWGPLLLTDNAARLPAEVHSYFLDVKPGYETNPTRAFYNHVWVIGDQEAISVAQQAEVNELAELAKIGGEG